MPFTFRKRLRFGPPAAAVLLAFALSGCDRGWAPCPHGSYNDVRRSGKAWGCRCIPDGMKIPRRFAWQHPNWGDFPRCPRQVES